MRLPRIRIAIRHLMILVAIAAVVIALAKRSKAYSRLATIHSVKAAFCENGMVELNEKWNPAHECIWSDVIQCQTCLEHRKRFVSHHMDWKHKYEHAARFPWLFIEPDSPDNDYVRHSR